MSLYPDIIIAALAAALCACLLWVKKLASAKPKKTDLETEELKKALRHRADLVNEIAHEIKNPITAMLCSVETLSLILASSLDETNRTTLKYMKEYGDHILRLVSDFIDVSRAEGGTLTASPDNVNISNTIESVVELLRSSAIGKNVSIKFVKENPRICAYVDEKHLKQIIFNLVHNAIKFSEARGEITIYTSVEPTKKEVLISVRDSGKGIKPELIDKIFDLYATYDEDAPVRDVGVGLGLALTKNLVELAKGKIKVQSEYGKGSDFEFSLPYASDEAILEDKQCKTKDEQPLCGQSFLLVDQDESSRVSVASLIEAWGGMVDQVNSASDALRAVGEYNYTAVVVDKTVDCDDPSQTLHSIKLQADDNTTMILTRRCDEKVPENISKKVKSLAKPFNGTRLLESLRQK